MKLSGNPHNRKDPCSFCLVKERKVNIISELQRELPWGYVKEKAIKQYFCVLGYGETGEVPVYGTHSILPKEHGAKFFALPIVRHLTREVGAIATWDSSIHDSVCLNTVTSGKLLSFQSNLVSNFLQVL